MFRTNFIAILIFFLFTSQISTHFQKPHNKLENNAITVPIYSNYFELYSYFIYVQVGTPSVNFSVILDTGSSDFLIPAYNCVDCAGGLPKNKYNPAHSSTYTPISCTNSSFTCSTCVDENLCGFTMPYVGITENATGVIDVVNNTIDVVKFPFGMITSITFGPEEEIYRYPEGMLGLAYSSLNTLGTETYLDALVNANLISNSFSICVTVDGGFLTLGGSRLDSEEYQYTPIIKEDYYRINITDILIGDKSLGYSSSFYNSKNCIIDSGTSIPTLPFEAFQSLQEILLSNCTNNPLSGLCVNLGVNGTTLFDDECFNMNSEEISMWPNLTFILENNVKLVYSSEFYLMKMYYCEKGLVGMGIGMEVNWAIVGARLLQVYETFFDRVNSRVGFAPSQSC